MIDQIGFLPKKPLVSLDLGSAKDAGAASIAKDFGSFLNGAMNNLNKQHTAVDTLNDKFVTGEIADVHQLTIAAEKLSLSLEMTVQIRNKVIEAYQEVMRTQI
ncbi:flagellar hook-basal body complex protein FliE [Paenibacillus hemerocallicola]|jgi:flagellar hook-basal body complex protein FliE|uniref:Flagellar hook-basal body complex protein FliE n=1 Tax=Paenibacillus hemerocallicola TaxID=1172614 RepID=A0A5C4T6L0_9BACL|nr:flagellar hook-basal body complex protein FliE [Paenibacillus hemerocallicola]TNJ64290.1 flagellar hook-basal body complex protein FliE [Paenibacillus hemerocallicola]